MQEIRTTQLVKQYKNLTAVDMLDLEIRQGELFSLLGVNGAGKTTAIKMLSCLTKPTSGDAIVGGYSITKEPEQVKRLIGVSPQETAVAPNLSVKENLELICGIHSFSKEKTEAKIRELSVRFALDTVLKTSVIWSVQLHTHPIPTKPVRAIIICFAMSDSNFWEIPYSPW